MALPIFERYYDDSARWIFGCLGKIFLPTAGRGSGRISLSCIRMSKGYPVAPDVGEGARNLTVIDYLSTDVVDIAFGSTSLVPTGEHVFD